ncbi:MAG: hypothetical protein LIP02_10465, partial [Bacteroidales bacterium]|nr:hypothetical protein [Bacteroidales bacterium]
CIRAVAALGEEEKIGWVEAFRDCCKNKKSAPDCERYRADYESDLWHLAAEVHHRIYEPSASKCFMVTKPKLREVFAAAFRDRIVHHWICLRLNPFFEQRHMRQGNVSHNCRKGFGTKSAIKALSDAMAELSCDWKSEAWVAKFDLSNFFMSIDCCLLWNLLKPFIEENYQGDDKDTLLYLTEKTVMHRPQSSCEIRSKPELWRNLPKRKSLRWRTDNVGMAIGNLTSQLFANFYMSFFDEWISAECAKVGARYVRFVDDFALVCKDKRWILEMRPRIAQWLKENLHLSLHPDKFYLQDCRKGANFVGAVIKPYRTHISHRTMGGLREALWDLERQCSLIIAQGCTAQNLRELERLVSSANSYLGFTKHHACYRRRLKMIQSLGADFWRVCRFKDGSFLAIRINHWYKLKNYLLFYEQCEILRLRGASPRRVQKNRGRKNLHGQLRRSKDARR